jgi:hypothetical protein
VASSAAQIGGWPATANLVQNSNQTQSGQSKLAPCLAVFQDKLWVAFISNDGNNRILLCSAQDEAGTTWTDNFAVPGQSAQGSPNLAVFKNPDTGVDELWVAFISNDSHNRVLYCTWDGNEWSGSQIVQNSEQSQYSQSTPALAIFKGKLFVAFISNDTHNAILVCSWDGRNWSNCYAVQGQSSGTAPALVNVDDDELWVAFGSNDGDNLLLLCSSPDGRNWVRRDLPDSVD